MRFLLSRRWVLFAVTVALLAWLAVQLGQWQFGRLDDRRAENERVARNLGRAPAPVEDVLAVGRPPAVSEEWRRVTVTGTWDDESTVVLKYQSRDEGTGVDVVTPLRTPSGAAVLVDRGWMPSGNSGAERPDLPAVDSGTVTVTGWVRRDGSGSSTQVSDLSTRAISSRAIGEVVPYPLYAGFLDLEQQRPAPAAELVRAEPPDVDSEGPHFFYGLQWWFFGALAVFGFGYLAWDERRGAREAARQDTELAGG